MGHYGFYGFYFDPTYWLVLIGAILCLYAQAKVSSAYSKYSKVRSRSGLTGAQAAQRILDLSGIYDVRIERIGGSLTDHYDPANKVLRLSDSVYGSASIAAIGVAAHECGHAIQDKEGYIFMIIRSQIVPIVNFASYAGYIAIVLGMFFGSMNLIWLGILSEIAILIFQLVTLPVEINASKRALKELDYAHFLDSTELSKAKTTLIAAALTYVASVATTLIQIARLLLMFGRRDD